MPSHKEFKAWVLVDGSPRPEFAVQYKDRKVECFIQSEPGKKFELHWSDSGSNTFTAGYIEIDGYTCSGRYLHGEGGTYRAGVRTGPLTERPFAFADIPKPSSKKTPLPPPNPKVGTIALKIMQAQRGPGRPANKFEILPGVLASKSDTVTTGGHCATFAKQDAIVHEQSPYTWSTKPLDPNYPHSYVKFIFHYRSREWLQQHGHLPQDPPPRIYGLRRVASLEELVKAQALAAPVGGSSSSFVVPPNNLGAQYPTNPKLLPTVRVGDVATGKPARVPSGKAARTASGDVKVKGERSASGSHVPAAGDVSSDGSESTVRAGKRRDPGDIAAARPPSSRPPIFAPTDNAMFLIPTKPLQQPSRRVASGSGVTSKPGSSSSSNLPQLPGRGVPSGVPMNVGPGIGAPSNMMHAAFRRPLGSRNVSNSSVTSVGSAGTDVSVPSQATETDWTHLFGPEEMDES